MPPDDAPRAMKTGLAALVFVLSFAAFAPALQGGWMNWDDDCNFVDNPDYRGLTPRHVAWMFTTFHGVHYQPLAWLTHAANYAIGGMDPGIYKLTNMLFHATGAMLLYLVIVELLVAAGFSDGRIVRASSALCALLWGVHPLRAESVAWITERRGVLSGVFLLLSTLAYLRMVRATDDRRRRLLVLSIAAYLCACLSKAWVMMFPAALLVMDAFPLRRLEKPDRGRVVLEKIPFAVLGAATVAVAFAFQLGVSSPVSLQAHSVSERMLQAAYGLVFYVRATVLPVGLSPLYPADHFLRITDWRYGLSLAVLAAAVVALVVRRRAWAGPAAALGAYAVMVFPMLGFMQSGPFLVADRYAYLATMPLFVLPAAAACRVAPHVRSAVGAGGCAAVAILAVLSWHQSQIWHDSTSLWSRAVEAYPRSFFALYKRGTAWQAAGRHEAALRDLDASLAITRRYAPTFAARCLSRLALRDAIGGLADGDEAVRLDPKMPTAYANRGVARRASGDVPGAMADFKDALRLEPNLPETRCNLGLALLETGDASAAIPEFEACLALRPTYVPALLGRLRARELAGDAAGALADCERLLRVLPGGSPQRRAVEEAAARLRGSR